MRTAVPPPSGGGTAGSGISPAGGGRGSGELAGLLVGGEHVDAAGVALLVGVRGRQEGLDEADGLVLRVHAAADGDDVGVVVLTAELSGLHAPGQDGADALDLVRGDLLPVAGAADHDAEAALVRGGLLRGAEAEGRVVVHGVVDVGATVDGLVAVVLEPVHEVVLELKAGMVGSEVHAHGTSVARGGPTARSGCRVSHF